LPAYLHDLGAGAVADRVGAVLERLDATHVDAAHERGDGGAAESIDVAAVHVVQLGGLAVGVPCEELHLVERDTLAQRQGGADSDRDSGVVRKWASPWDTVPPARVP
jgi:hypothetical protein